MDLDIVNVLERHADAYRHKPALVDDTGTWTYGQLWAEVLDIAPRLRAIGLGEGTRVAVMMPPGRGYAAILLAGLRASAAVVPVNTRLTRPELASFVAACMPIAILLAEEFVDLVADVDVDRYLVSARSGSWSVSPMPAGASRPARSQAAFAPGEAIIIGTGGTTGVPKGAVLSRSAVWHWTICAAFAQRLRGDDVELFGSPFFHSTLLTGLLTPLVAAATVCIPDRFDAAHVGAAVREHGVTRFGGAPTMLARVLGSAWDDAAGWRTVRTVQFGSTKAPPGFVASVRDALPDAELITGYGSTEFGPVTRRYTEDFADDLDGAVGRPVPGASVTIIDSNTGRPTRTPGVEGQIAVNCPWQMSYYTGDRAATDEVMHAGGAILSGDMGRFDESGALVLVGRLKEMIITGGENVFPAEVERVLERLPDVQELAVYGVPDPEWGERVEVAVSVAAGAAAPTLADIRNFGRGRLADYKLPRRVVVLDELPLTSNAKVDKRCLAESAGDEGGDGLSHRPRDRSR